MRAPLLAIAVVVALGILVACGDAPRTAQVRATFVSGVGDRATSTPTVRGAIGTPAVAPPRVQCDLQNSTLQDSGLPLLQMDPIAPRRGEVVTVTASSLPPGSRTMTLMTPLQADVRIDVTVASDGRLRATFRMPPVVAGKCAMLVLDGVGVQSLGFVVAE